MGAGVSKSGSNWAKNSELYAIKRKYCASEDVTLTMAASVWDSHTVTFSDGQAPFVIKAKFTRFGLKKQKSLLTADGRTIARLEYTKGIMGEKFYALGKNGSLKLSIQIQKRKDDSFFLISEVLSQKGVPIVLTAKGTYPSSIMFYQGEPSHSKPIAMTSPNRDLFLNGYYDLVVRKSVDTAMITMLCIALGEAFETVCKRE